MSKKNISDLEVASLKGRTVLVRADLNDRLRRARNPEAVLTAYLEDLKAVQAEAANLRATEATEGQPLFVGYSIRVWAKTFLDLKSAKISLVSSVELGVKASRPRLRQ